MSVYYVNAIICRYVKRDFHTVIVVRCVKWRVLKSSNCEYNLLNGKMQIKNGCHNVISFVRTSVRVNTTISDRIP